MAQLHHWRVLHRAPKEPSDPMPFLCARMCIGRLGWEHKTHRIVTSILVSGDCTPGGQVQTHSGTLYELGEALPAEESCDFIFDLLMQQMMNAYLRAYRRESVPFEILETKLMPLAKEIIADADARAKK